MSGSPSPDAEYLDPVALTQRLVRFDTTNPSGNEGECIAHIKSLLDGAGIQNQVLAKTPGRPNLNARLPGDGSAAPLLLQGHVDVVSADPSRWQQPPFGGDIVDGVLWGRGSLDMKGSIAMMLHAIMRAKADRITPAGDIMLALGCDEESGGDHGARYMVEENPELFQGIRYAIGEFGGFSFNLGRQRFYPIMVAEKQVCHLRVTYKGLGGHASLIHGDNPMADLARLLLQVQSRNLPTHVTPEARMMFQAIGRHLSPIARLGMADLLNSRFTALALKLMGSRGRSFGPLFRNTVNPTIVRGGDQINVVPGVVSVDLDGRLLPNMAPDRLISELAVIAGKDATISRLVRHSKWPFTGERSGRHPCAHAHACGDGWKAICPPWHPNLRFLPMLLPSTLDFAAVTHGPDERAAVDAINFGADAVYRLLQRYGRTP